MKENHPVKEERDEGKRTLFSNSTPWILNEVPLTLLSGAICGAMSVATVSLKVTDMAFINILNIWLEEAPLFSVKMAQLMGEGALYGSTINLIMVGLIGHRSAERVETKGIIITSLIAGGMACLLAILIKWRF